MNCHVEILFVKKLLYYEKADLMNISGFYNDDKFKDYYYILQVDRDAEPEVISFAYKALAKKNHPDVGGTAEKMKLINEAYDILKDTDIKVEYDKIYDAEKVSKLNNEGTKIVYSNQIKTDFYEEPEDDADETVVEPEKQKQEEQQVYDDLFERAIEENLSDNVYEVFVKDFNFLLPWSCICCLENPDSQIKVKHRFSKGNALFGKYGSLIIPFPICRACNKHLREYLVNRILFLVLSLAPGTIMAFLIKNKIPGITLTSLMIMGCVITIISTLLFNALIKMSAIEDVHANRGTAAGISNCDEAGTKLWFYNWLYAKTFAEQNNSRVITVSGKRDGRSRSMLGGGMAPMLLSFILLLMIVIIILVSGYFDIIKGIPEEFKKAVQSFFLLILSPFR